MAKTFNSKAIPKCYDRLSKAKRALQQSRSAHNFEDFSSAWSEFLIHTGGVLNALDAGSKTTPQGRQWYGGIKRHAKEDELLLYMHQARNVEEHSLDATTENEPPSIKIGPMSDGGVKFDNLHLNDGFLKNPTKNIIGKAWRTKDGLPPTIINNAGGPILKRISDERYGNEFQPPEYHDGKRLLNNSPLFVAEIYMQYLTRVIKKAAELT